MFLLANGSFTGARRLFLAQLLHHMCCSWAWLLARFMTLMFLNILRKVVCRIWLVSAISGLLFHLFVHIVQHDWFIQQCFLR
jgi:hypothetical protein